MGHHGVEGVEEKVGIHLCLKSMGLVLKDQGLEPQRLGLAPGGVCR
jgi:hypothetical protein